MRQCENVTLTADMVFNSESVFMIICYSFLFVVAVIGNVTMLLILVRNLRVKVRRVYTLLLHMNIADLLVTLIYLPKEIVHNATVVWYGGDIACRLCKFFDTFGVYLSANVLICISLDRFFSIIFPLYSLQAQQRVKRMLILAWTVAAVSSLPQIVIVACYSMIVWKISKKEAATDESKLSKSNTSDTGGKLILRSSADQNNMRRAKHKTLRMTVVMVAAFLVCWTPYFVAVTIHFVDLFTANPNPNKERVPRLMRKFLYAFALFNSSVNPFLYGFFSFDLRQELNMLVSWLCSERIGRSHSLSSGQFASAITSRRTSYTRTPNSVVAGRAASEPSAMSLSVRTSHRGNVIAGDRTNTPFLSPNQLRVSTSHSRDTEAE